MLLNFSETSPCHAVAFKKQLASAEVFQRSVAYPHVRKPTLESPLSSRIPPKSSFAGVTQLEYSYSSADRGSRTSFTKKFGATDSPNRFWFARTTKTRSISSERRKRFSSRSVPMQHFG